MLTDEIKTVVDLAVRADRGDVSQEEFKKAASKLEARWDYWWRFKQEEFDEIYGMYFDWWDLRDRCEHENVLLREAVRIEEEIDKKLKKYEP